MKKGVAKFPQHLFEKLYESFIKILKERRFSCFPPYLGGEGSAVKSNFICQTASQNLML